MSIRKLQIVRRCVQWSIVILMLAVPAAARYKNYLAARELNATLEKWDGTLQGHTLSVIDKAFRALPGGETDRAGAPERDRAQVLAYAQQVRGGPWSMAFGRLSMTDPLAGAESIVGSKRLVPVLLISLIVPVVVALVLGRVFCSWICPVHLLLEMTDKLRRVFAFLEIKPLDIPFDRRTKYVLLVVGLVLTAFLARPVLGYIYPPAILNREFHDLVFAWFNRAELGRFGLWVGGLTWMSLIILGIVLFEVLVSRRWWCRHVCPGGALYSLMGWRRPIRVVLDEAACTQCKECIRVCPMGLDPMLNKMGAECDNCGLCISHCEDDALNYRVKIKGRPSFLPLVLGFLLLGSTASAHHILGIPHYSYDEQYPQTPVLTYRVESGPFDIRMTGYPGRPMPGDRCSVYVYVSRVADGMPFDDTVTCTVFRKQWFGEDETIYGPMAATLDQSVYKFYPTFDNEADYTLRIEFQAEGVPWIIDLPMVVGEPGSPWGVLAGVGGAIMVFLIVIRAIRIKRNRFRKTDED